MQQYVEWDDAPQYPNSYTKNSYQRGAKFQDFALQVIAREIYNPLTPLAAKENQYGIGDTLQGWEFKLDAPCTVTGRVSIEVEEKRDSPTWRPSGIYAPSRSWIYVQGNYELIFVLQKNILTDYVMDEEPEIKETGTATNAVRKFYLPLEWMRRRAGRVLDGMKYQALWPKEWPEEKADIIRRYKRKREQSGDAA